MGWVHRQIILPFFGILGSERAHGFALRTLRMGSSFGIGRAILKSRCAPRTSDPVEVWGLSFPNRFGIAAGLDKKAEAIRGWNTLGVGFIEIGGVTAHAQPGNPRPRMFRLSQHQALINRMGFNNDGCEAMARRLQHYRQKHGDSTPILANLGKSKVTPNSEALEDYSTSMQALHSVVDGFVVNVSSPNTPGLRDLQHEDALRDLLSGLRTVCDSLNRGTKQARPMLVNFSPDVENDVLLGMVDVAMDCGADGVVLSNTTVERPRAASKKQAKHLEQQGGLSGTPLRDRSTELIRCVSKHTGGTWPIIGVGGIMTAADAQEKLDAGAVLVQAYSAFVFVGMTLPRRIVDGMASTRA